MVWEPFFNREYDNTDFDVVSKGYDIIREVGVRVGHHPRWLTSMSTRPNPSITTWWT